MACPDPHALRSGRRRGPGVLAGKYLEHVERLGIFRPMPFELLFAAIFILFQHAVLGRLELDGSGVLGPSWAKLEIPANSRTPNTQSNFLAIINSPFPRKSSNFRFGETYVALSQTMGTAQYSPAIVRLAKGMCDMSRDYMPIRDKARKVIRVEDDPPDSRGILRGGAQGNGERGKRPPFQPFGTRG